MLHDMNECGAALHSYLSNQKVMFTDAKELASSLSRIYQSNTSMTEEDWPNSKCALSCDLQAIDFARQWVKLSDVTRSSSAAVCAEQALDRLRNAVTKMGPEIDAAVKERNIQQKDYDSYKRRLKALETKKETYDNEGKGASKAALENAEELEKFQRKVETGLENYNYHNKKTKDDIIAAKLNHDEIMDHLLTTTLVCQAELFSQTAHQLNLIIKSLPDQRKVEQIRQRIHDFEAQGGVKSEKPDKSKNFSILPKVALTSSAPIPAPPAGERKSTPATAVANPAAMTHKPPPPPPASNPFAESGNPFADDSSPPASPSAPSAPPVAVVEKVVDVKKDSATLVEALFDHAAEEEDELNFATGDVVEVLEISDNGWWKGRCHGKEGLFPVNYVQPYNS